MGMFGKIKSLFSGGSPSESGEPGDVPPNVSLPNRLIEVGLEPQGITISIGISGAVPGRHDATSEQLSHKLHGYTYVLQPELTSSSDFVPWAPPSREVRRLSLTLPNTHWSTPFLPGSVAELDEIKKALAIGVNGHERIAVVLRALIRERRKAKIAHVDLLHALYGTAVLGELVTSLQRERSTFFEDLAPFVDFKTLLAARMSFQWMGYERVSTLKKTDIKWLVGEFGEPSVHLSYLPLNDSLRRDAVRRYCRAEVIRLAGTSLTPHEVETALPQVLRRKLEFSISIDNENEAMASATAARYEKRVVALQAIDTVWLATHGNFIVADIETTGLDPSACEILEIAGLLVSPQGEVLDEFSTLIRVKSCVPAFIEELTGISSEMVEKQGIQPHSALAAFLDFANHRPMFFHNAEFDMRFLNAAFAKHGLAAPTNVIDTLPIARAAWPSMKSHKLSTLVKILNGAPEPSHRALADAKSTLAVLLAARELARQES